MALIVMALGGLVLAPSLEYVATGVTSAATQRRLTSELYAADAGVEYAMWRIENGASGGFTDAISVGAIPVDVTASVLTDLPYGPVLTAGAEHADWLSVTTEMADLGGGVFSLAIHIQNTGGTGNVKLETIGAGMPEGFSYVAGSSSGFTTGAPGIDGRKLAWEFSGSGRPTVNDGQSVTQTFQMSGAGDPQRYYSWVVASRDDIGIVSSARGYNVVSTAGDARIEAAVVKNEGIVYPVSWNITRSVTP
ncbi:MAG: hypothetical protein Q7T04_07895 [Dehalococcoidia bacterium]|nr:hypothetical protein [Dehalococcoidia bacterium]